MYYNNLVSYSFFFRQTGEGVPKGQSFLYEIKNGTFEKRVFKTALMNIHRMTKSKVSIIYNLYDYKHSRSKQYARFHESRSTKYLNILWSSMRSIWIAFSEEKRERKITILEETFHQNWIMLMQRLYLKKNEPHQYNQRDKQELKPKYSYIYYRSIFIENFNLSFGHPRIDTCKVCDLLENK